MNILGISGSLDMNFNHDCSVALLVDGKLVENIEEERFNRIKHSVGKFPELTLREVLDKHNLTLADIDAIGIPFSDMHKAQNFLESLDLGFDKNKTKLFYENHHLNHLMDSFYQSGFDSAAAMIIDGSGDMIDGLSIYTINNKEVKTIKKYNLAQSLGNFYVTAIDYAGFIQFEEGKFMGLSSYGKPYDLHNLIEFKDGEIVTKYVIDPNINCLRLFEYYYEKNCYPFNRNDNQDVKPGVFYYIDFAASIQKKYNEIVSEMCKWVKETTGEENLILSGGCIQNCIGNEAIVNAGCFKNVFAAPAPHDAGCAAGLAFYVARKLEEKIENERLKCSYTGKTYPNTEIEKVPSKYKIIKYDKKLFASLLKNRNIAGWFQGGAEIGPRALGHRSIIADPSDRDNLIIINERIKHREVWRPLAPSIPAELFDKVFDTPSHDLCEFMLRTLIIRPEMRRKLISVCHIDNSTRPQYLEREINPEYYDMIMEFYRISGCPGVINTSFNDRGEPIVETLEQALNDFEKWDEMSTLVYNAEYMILKEGVLD